MRTGQGRSLVVVADDLGIGPATSAGILQLAELGVVSGAALLVNCPTTEDAVARWREAACQAELGWHPNFTLDAPLLPQADVPSLVGADGRFHPLSTFLRRWLLGGLDATEIRDELDAQYVRFVDLVGEAPAFVNSHQHVALFPPVGAALVDVLRRRGWRGYVRRVQEPWATLGQVPGARIKRAVLNALGRRQGRLLTAAGFPGNDWLAGIADPAAVRDPRYFERWLGRVPGDVVELVCHPGHLDTSLVGRDCGADDGLLQRRVDELALLRGPGYLAAVERAGFRLVAPSTVAGGVEACTHAV